MSRNRQRGQGVVEFVVMIGVFGSFLLGILQVALLYRAKTRSTTRRSSRRVTGR